MAVQQQGQASIGCVAVGERAPVPTSGYMIPLVHGFAPVALTGQIEPLVPSGSRGNMLRQMLAPMPARQWRRLQPAQWRSGAASRLGKSAGGIGPVR